MLVESCPCLGAAMPGFVAHPESNPWASQIDDKSESYVVRTAPAGEVVVMDTPYPDFSPKHIKSAGFFSGENIWFVVGGLAILVLLFKKRG